MKTFWKKMFWWDAPAKGAFFALTLLLVGAYVLGSVFLFAWETGWLGRSGWLLPESGVWQLYFLVPLAVLLLYYLFETLCFFFRSGKGWMRYLGVIGLPLWIGFGIVWMRHNPYDVPNVLVWLWPMAFFTVILPAASSGKHWRWAVPGALLWGLGAFLVWDALPVFDAGMDLFRFSKLSGGPEATVIPLVQRLGISGYGWAAWFALGSLLFAGWYFLTAKLLAGMVNRRFRAMFGRPVLALWGVKILIYLTFSGMVIYEKGQVSHSLAELERRFGRPVTTEALGEFYFGGNQPDTEFWKQEQRLRIDDHPGTSAYDTVLSSPNAIFTDANLRKFRLYLERPDSTAAQWEQLFSGSIPPPPMKFKEGMLYEINSSHLFDIWKFNCLQLWRIRFALADGRTEDALTAYRRMEHVNRSLLREIFFDGGMVWLEIENLRLDGVEMLLESGRLTDGQLREISTELARIEPEFPRFQERIQYGNAVEEIDLCDAMVSGVISPRFHEWLNPVPVRVLRYYFPQFWWLCLREKAIIARTLNIADFSHRSAKNSNQSILGDMVQSGLNSVGNRFDELAARVRGMRALIAAELWKREHGNYPDPLPDPPEDPRTGKPLLYRKGESRIEVERVSYNPETKYWDRQTEERTVPAVQVWSPAAGDDGPRNKTRAILRLPNSDQSPSQ